MLDLYIIVIVARGAPVNRTPHGAPRLPASVNANPREDIREEPSRASSRRAYGDVART